MVTEAAIPYESTATARATWADLPAPVRGEVETRLGAPVISAASAGAGFTAGLASRLTLASGGRVFLKAESSVRNPPIAAAYRREAQINRALPASLPAPRMRWSTEAADWTILAFDDIGGRTPRWTSEADVRAMLSLVSEVSEVLATPPAGLDLNTLADDAQDLTTWRDLAGGGLAGGDIAGGGLAGGGLGAWTSLSLDVLAGLEAGWEAAAAGTAMIHCDLRPDNVIAEPSGRAWLCDWNWPCLAAAWVDLVMMLPGAHGAGIDADAVLAAHPVGRAADPDAVNAVLAAFAGLFIAQSAEPAPVPASSWIRAHQRSYGRLTLRWLESRLR
jgi:hypothetical protein